MTREPRGDKRIDANFAWLILSLRHMLGDSKSEFKDCLLTFESTRGQKKDGDKKIANAFRMYAKAFDRKDGKPK